MKNGVHRIVFATAIAIGGISLLSWLYSLLALNAFFSTLAGIATFLVMWMTAAVLMRRSAHVRDRDMHTQILDALAEIGRGNFDILLDEERLSPHNEMVGAFNKMARDLGDIEAMRRDFVSNVSHEIQSPLTSIKGFAALLKDDSLTVGERRHYAEVIENESQRLSSLSDSLLKLSALDSEKTTLNVHAFRLDRQLQQVALMLEPQWSAKGIDFEVDLARCEYSGDAGLLNQIWINLIHNAVKFTPDGGRIRVRLASGDRVTVTVADNGEGIADSDIVHIFERFYKADKSRARALGGNGLGLSIVKKIADMHGGGVSVESEAGKGTVFTVTLPLAQPGGHVAD
jgi:signal transduction histidine kinase